MKFRFAITLITTLSVIAVRASVADEPTACTNELTEDQIRGIVGEEYERRFPNVPRKSDSRFEIKREGCNYIYFEEELPQKFGGDFTVTIDQFGKVMDFFPGL